ncbi:MAG: molecular chaperone DnaK [Chitinophagaceae bacterium]
MKKKILLGLVAGAATFGGIIFAADHIDAPAVTGPGNASLGTDITDIYAFQSPSDNSKLVFVMNTQGLLSPSATASASFPSNVMYEFNIDNTGDAVEDLVIQCLVQNGKLRVYGPVAPVTTGLTSTVKTNGPVTETSVTAYGSNPSIGTNSNGIKIFAGPRDDPFFFDLTRFKEIIAGTQTSFRNPGVDFFAGTNVMSIVVEVPKTLLGSATTLNVWGETKSK